MASLARARSLRKAIWTQRWVRICSQSTYFGVLALTQSSAWGRAGLRQRILHETKSLECDVDIRYAVPKWVRTALEQCRLQSLSPLFRGGSTLVVYGNDADAWLRVAKHTEQVIPGALLVGARIGSEPVVTRSVLETLQPFRQYGESFIAILEQPAAHLTEPVSSAVFALDEALNARLQCTAS
ncbi:hypothetical protein CCYA_CCYA12G3406 [Cyanidiococcus yangmingshanensis]|nr:hypothetical protein CCYA_CCYA12G3406 [Cyanidiococcus yangmingshanensis]